jgi:hypothetical protein
MLSRRSLSTLVLVSSLGICSGGCASIFHGTTETLSIQADVPSAQIYLDGAYVGQGAVSLKVPSDKGHSIQVRAAGYEDAWAGIGLDPIIGHYVLDILLTLGIGVYIDAATGAITTLERNHVAIKMAPLGSATDFRGAPLGGPGPLPVATPPSSPAAGTSAFPPAPPPPPPPTAAPAPTPAPAAP